MNSRDRKAAKQIKCSTCATILSSSGFATTSHVRSAGHIAALIATGHTEEANRLQTEVNIIAKNRRTQAENTRIWKASH